MSIYPYKSLGEGIPLAPMLEVLVTPPDWIPNPITAPTPLLALLDTGSDVTLIPLSLISVLRLQILGKGVPITGIGAGQLQCIPCFANIRLDQHVYIKAGSTVIQIINWVTL